MLSQGRRRPRPPPSLLSNDNAGAPLSTLNLTVALITACAFLVGIGPYAIMYLSEDSDGLGSSSRHVGPHLLLRQKGGEFGRMHDEYLRMAEVSKATGAQRGEQQGPPSNIQGGARTRKRSSRQLESTRRRDGYPRHITSSRGGTDFAELPVPVHILPTDDSSSPDSFDLFRFISEGIESSQRLRPAASAHEDGVVWVVDLSQVQCDYIVKEATRAMTTRLREHRTAVQGGLPSPFGNPPERIASTGYRLTSALRWKVVIIDFSDYGYVFDDDKYYDIDDFTIDCLRPLSDLLGRRNIFLASREHVIGRNVTMKNTSDDEEQFGPLGNIIDYSQLHLTHFMMNAVRHVDFGHRSILEKCLEQEAAKLDSVGDQRRQEEEVDFSTLPRKLDVAHFWKVGNDDNITGTVRNTVNSVVFSLGNSTETGMPLKIFAGHLGKDLGSYRSRDVTSILAQEMLRYKIVVVAQKDMYEGHYRLMDALLSGALVMTDSISLLPLFIIDKVSIVVYRSPAELRRSILYYLQDGHEEERQAIGRKGRDAALTHHSPAAWIERVIFGNWTSVTGAN